MNEAQPNSFKWRVIIFHNYISIFFLYLFLYPYLYLYLLIIFHQFHYKATHKFRKQQQTHPRSKIASNGISLIRYQNHSSHKELFHHFVLNGKIQKLRKHHDLNFSLFRRPLQSRRSRGGPGRAVVCTCLWTCLALFRCVLIARLNFCEESNN